jgi:preprotein translocase subunit SecA
MLTNTNIFSIPPQDESDVVFRATSGKWRAVVVEISRMNKTGRPVLVGTTSVESGFYTNKYRRNAVACVILLPIFFSSLVNMFFFSTHAFCDQV